MGADVGEEDQSILLKLMEELSMQESMAIYTGNLSTIKGLPKRMQDRLRKELGGDSDQAIKKMAEDEADRLRKQLVFGDLKVRNGLKQSV